MAAVLLLAAAGGVQAATPMTDAEFQEFLDAATAELRQKQETLSNDYGLADAATWGFDQASEKLQFFDDQRRMVVEADVIDAGSLFTKIEFMEMGLGQRVGTAPAAKKGRKAQGTGGHHRHRAVWQSAGI